MAPKEKAKELFDKFERIMLNSNADYWTKEAKQCALIVVEEIINSIKYTQFRIWHHEEMNAEYWGEVKQEIEKL